MFQIVCLVSGGGTNLGAIIEGIRNKTVRNTEIKAVISNNFDAFALQRARDNGIKDYCILPKSFESREEINKALLLKLQELKPD